MIRGISPFERESENSPFLSHAIADPNQVLSSQRFEEFSQLLIYVIDAHWQKDEVVVFSEFLQQ